MVRIIDMYVCLMVIGVVFYVGGLIVVGKFIVLIGFLFLVIVILICVCVGLFDVIVKGLMFVLVNYLLVVRMGDMIVYGGMIVIGFF